MPENPRKGDLTNSIYSRFQCLATLAVRYFFHVSTISFTFCFLSLSSWLNVHNDNSLVPQISFFNLEKNHPIPFRTKITMRFALTHKLWDVNAEPGILGPNLHPLFVTTESLEQVTYEQKKFEFHSPRWSTPRSWACGRVACGSIGARAEKNHLVIGGAKCMVRPKHENYPLMTHPQ